jgi:hypothetical protein
MKKSHSLTSIFLQRVSSDTVDDDVIFCASLDGLMLMPMFFLFSVFSAQDKTGVEICHCVLSTCLCTHNFNI